MDSIYSDIIFIRWTFIFVYFVGRAIHKIWDPTKIFIHFSFITYYLESMNSSVHKPCPFYPQTTKFCANQTKWFHKYLRESNICISPPPTSSWLPSWPCLGPRLTPVVLCLPAAAGVGGRGQQCPCGVSPGWWAGRRWTALRVWTTAPAPPLNNTEILAYVNIETILKRFCFNDYLLSEVRAFAPWAGGRRFVPWPRHTIDVIKMVPDASLLSAQHIEEKGLATFSS